MKKFVLWSTGRKICEGRECLFLSGGEHPDWDARLQHITWAAEKMIESRSLVISVDTRKKELLGTYKNGEKSGTGKGEGPVVDRP
jgi:hypothetical protein